MVFCSVENRAKELLYGDFCVDFNVISWSDVNKALTPGELAPQVTERAITALFL